MRDLLFQYYVIWPYKENTKPFQTVVSHLKLNDKNQNSNEPLSLENELRKGDNVEVNDLSLDDSGGGCFFFAFYSNFVSTMVQTLVRAHTL